MSELEKKIVEVIETMKRNSKLYGEINLHHLAIKEIAYCVQHELNRYKDRQ